MAYDCKPEDFKNSDWLAWICIPAGVIGWFVFWGLVGWMFAQA